MLRRGRGGRERKEERGREGEGGRGERRKGEIPRNWVFEMEK